MSAALDRGVKRKRIKAWMVLDAKGNPVIECHPWGGNFIIAKTRGEACQWNPGEKTVRVEIEICKPRP